MGEKAFRKINKNTTFKDAGQITVHHRFGYFDDGSDNDDTYLGM
jgi:hypothetical protein